jgi:hypothetical protein
VNISAPNGFKGGVFYLPTSILSFNIIQCTFTNVENNGDGGVIYSNAGNNYTITSCTFEECKSTSGSGGVVYINNTGILTFVNCKFLNNSNSGTSGGNDIYDNTNLASSYSSNNFVQTCSTSESPRIGFSDNTNLDNLLLGIFLFIFCLLIFLFLFMYLY